MLTGSKVRELREKAGLTREQLSEKTGISAQHLYRIEDGQSNLASMTYNNLKKLANGLDVSIQELTESDEEKMEAFIKALEKLNPKDRAVLRREAGKPMGQARTSDAYRVFYSNLPKGLAHDDHEEEICYQVAALATYGMALSEGNQWYATLPEAIKRMGTDGTNFMARHRVQNILDSYWGEDAFVAREMHKILKSVMNNDFRIDYVALLRDALRWNDENKPVAREWINVIASE